MTDLPPPMTTAADPFRPTRRSRTLLAAAFIGMTLAAILALIPLPYAVLRPGPAVNTLGTGSDGKPLVEVSGAPHFAAKGALDFTTVSVQGGPGGRVNVWDLIGAWIDPDDDVYPEAAFFPTGVTAKQVKDENAAEMSGSQEAAIAVALRSLGKTVTERYAVADVAATAPAHAVLRRGDRILAIDGTTIGALTDIRRVVQAHRPGDTLAVTIERDGSRQTVTTRTIDAGGRTAIGIVLTTDYEFPFAVTINAGDVGGPSAGLMFTLAVRDVLTSGDLTGGRRIAGTGTIDDTGAVGPIGGIRQKVVGAKESGAQFFLAPAQNCPDLAGRVPDDIQVVKVETFTDALADVQAIAAGKAGGLPSCG
jgi:PDZ domain-containing protein